MNPQAAAKPALAPQTPPLPRARPDQIGLSPSRLQKMSDAFKREVDKGTVPGVTVMVARRGQIGGGRGGQQSIGPLQRRVHGRKRRARRQPGNHSSGRGREPVISVV